MSKRELLDALVAIILLAFVCCIFVKGEDELPANHVPVYQQEE